MVQQQVADMSAAIDTYVLKRRKGRSGPVLLPEKRETDGKNARLQIECEGDPMDVDPPDSSFTDHGLSNPKSSKQIGTSGHNSSQLSSIFDGKDLHDASGSAKGLASFAMFSLLPRIMAYLPRDDLVRLALVNKDFYHEGMRVLYRHLAWDVQDEHCNTMVMRLITHKNTSASSLIKPAIIYVRSLFLQVRSPPGSYDHETGFRLGLLLSALPKLKFLKKLSVADSRDVREIKEYGTIPRMANFVEEIIWGQGTLHLDTFEILMDRDLTFFISLLSEDTLPSSQVTLNAPSHCHPKRKPSIKHFTLRGAYPKEGDSPSIPAFEYQLAYLLLVLSPSLTHLTLVGLPKPPYLACPQDVGTGEWGGSVGKVFEILGPRALRSLEELTIEAADTRYEVAEGALSSWITERSIYVKPPTDEEIQQKRLKNEERELRQSEPTEDNDTLPCPISNELCWQLFGRFHYEDYGDDAEPHINCDSQCPIHGNTSGTFTLSKATKEPNLHVNPLLRRQQPKRRFRHLHLLNCPEPWPAFYTIACLHPPTTMHFSSPWMDSSSTDIPDSLRESGIEKYRLAVTPKLRKAYGESPVIPNFNQGSFIAGVDHSDRDQALPRLTGTHRLHCRRIRKKMEQYMSMLEQVPAESCPLFSPSLAQVVASNMKRIELRTLERVSMKLLQIIVKWYGESLEIIGISRLDGSHKEASATGHVRGWGKILGHCSKLRELRIVWNLFDDIDWEEVKGSGTIMKFGIGERSVGGKEALIGFSEEDWWQCVGSRTQESKEITEIDDSSSDIDNGEGPSTQRPTLEATSETPAVTVSADKSSESREDATRPNNTQATQDTASSPVRWLETWCGWSAIKKFFPPETSCFSYITAEGGRYLKKSEGPTSSHNPTQWTNQQMKELLLFLIDWKYRKLEEMWAMSTAAPRPPAKRSLSPQRTWRTGYHERPIVKPPNTEGNIALQPRYRSGAWGDTFRVAYEGTASSNKVYHVLFTDMTYPFLSMDRHNARVFQERLKEEYLAREEFLASTIWDIIDTDIGKGKRVDQQGWRDRFLVTSTSDQAQVRGLKPPKGIIFTNPNYNVFDGDKNTEAGVPEKRLGQWENALNELLTQTPPVFDIPTNDRLRVCRHQLIISQLSSFFQEINLWHRKVRLESTLGHGLRRFCGLAWVMFEEVPTLENVVGLLENGREVIAHPVRNYHRPKKALEMVKIRCWSCGGGWAGDYRNGIKGSGNTPLRTRVGARECRCDFSNAQSCQAL
ncbi:hypothetical protein L211DRAFT_867976 [Terfezia boudieri ATCC MYA-4762]|uniref:F-box domain-containing protein n=1 Tax=Terfezia boudieri ATCC MYA-4762 TaxID=1051890 RepID=A0A3N4LTW8_9PEZI|nr:hypothetical protein L211DRAFT_867976 [Terfezia boudieri ATCC MYA-4762]